MPTRNINLTVEQDAFVDERRLRALVREGVDDLERGAYVDVDAAGLQKMLGLARPRRKRTR